MIDPERVKRLQSLEMHGVQAEPETPVFTEQSQDGEPILSGRVGEWRMTLYPKSPYSVVAHLSLWGSTYGLDRQQVHDLAQILSVAWRHLQEDTP